MRPSQKLWLLAGGLALVGGSLCQPAWALLFQFDFTLTDSNSSLDGFFTYETSDPSGNTTSAVSILSFEATFSDPGFSPITFTTASITNPPATVNISSGQISTLNLNASLVSAGNTYVLALKKGNQTSTVNVNGGGSELSGNAEFTGPTEIPWETETSLGLLFLGVLFIVYYRKRPFSNSSKSASS